MSVAEHPARAVRDLATGRSGRELVRRIAQTGQRRLTVRLADGSFVEIVPLVREGKVLRPEDGK